MKNVLFATTALIATAGLASAAEFKMGGDARLGVIYTDNDALSSKTEIEQRMRIVATGIAETDSGVKLEVRTRWQSNSSEGTNVIAGSAGNAAAGFAVSYEGLRLDVGSVSDVIDSGDHFSHGGTGVGLTGFIEQNASAGLPASGFGGNTVDFTTVKVLYKAGDFGVSASYQTDDSTTPSEWQVGAGYSFGAISVGAAVGSSDDTSIGDFWAAGLSGSAGAFSYNVLVSDTDEANHDVAYGFSGSYAVSSATAIQFAFAGGGDDGADEAYGIGASHDLGGGVTLKGGIGRTAGETGALDGFNKADFGVSFSF